MTLAKAGVWVGPLMLLGMIMGDADLLGVLPKNQTEPALI
jgi:hypothetical protein